MKNPYGVRLSVSIILVNLAAMATVVTAQTLVWDGQGAFNNWSNSLNWNPNSLPGVGNDLVINQVVDTNVDQDFSIRGLSLSGGATSDTNGHFLGIGFGGLDVGLGSTLIVSPHTAGQTALQSTGIEIVNLATLQMNGGNATIGGSVSVNGGGLFRGFGSLNFSNGLGSPVTVFTNNGTLATGRAAGAAATDRFTLTISANDGDARIDLDGVSNNRLVNIVENTTLNVDMKALDFGGTMTLDEGSVLNMYEAWRSESGSVFNISTGLPNSATVKNGHWTAQTGTDINIFAGSQLIIDSGFESQAGSRIDVSTNGNLQFDKTAVIHGDLNTTGIFRLTVNGDLTINDTNWDWDGTSSSSNTTIGTGAKLTVSAGSIDPADNEYDGTLNIDGGTLVTSIVGGIFNVGSGTDVNINTTSGNATIRGSFLALQGDLNVSGENTATLVDGVRFDPGSSSDVDAGATLRIIDLARFRGGTTHTGDGRLSFAADINVEANTTINMPGGVVALDSSGSNNTISVDNDLTINAATMGTVGSAGFGTQTIEIDNRDSTLQVNLTNPAAEWTLGADGVINITGTATLQTSLGGSDANIQGRVYVNDDTRFATRLDIESAAIVDVSDNTLYLLGGSAADPNTIAGGFINGNNGRLISSGDKALTGFGTINPDILFTTGADLRAEGGTLVINGNLIDVDMLGSGPGATLQLNNPFDTSVVTALELGGGTVSGQPISNTGVIRGHGMIKSIGLSNLGSISAEGGELVIDTTNAPDLDSFGSVAALNAVTGNLTVVDALSDDFSGTATIGAGHKMDFQGGWTQGPIGELFLTGTTTAAAKLHGGQTILRGTTTIDRQAEIWAPTTFASTGEFLLLTASTDLIIKANSIIEAGATFNTGELINDGFVMTLNDLANVNLRVENRGQLNVAGAGVGEAFVRTLELGGEGSVEFHIAGNMPGDYDVLNWQNSALLDGELEVILSGFTPSWGDTFSLLTSVVGVTSGTFATTNLPTLPGGLEWFVDYSDAHAVVLEVVGALISGDFDGNGDYACSDIDMLVAVVATGSNDSAYDLTGDGAVDGDDLQAWLAEAGAAELTSGMPYLRGDANLDGTVDGQDFIEWNTHKFTNTPAWCAGDFNADGVVDGQDFITWNGNKFTSADGTFSAVPEPSPVWLLVFGAIGFVALRRGVVD